MDGFLSPGIVFVLMVLDHDVLRNTVYIF